MAKSYVVLIQEKPAKTDAAVYWYAYRKREDALAQCHDLARYQHDQLQAKGPVELTKLTTPVVEMETNEVNTQVDGYKVTAANFTGRYTVQLIRAIRD
ncbi:hypothetical protein [[Lactobacillus] timonensis]|jgi:hypothetical protein|uniref:hypothetical protein n=1 Tax=[Lactobacillus] timonensis TaxID=1970790 RepID=UPI000C842A43|nr:hypothetical protein [[Lactobacillus] timonensis]